MLFAPTNSLPDGLRTTGYYLLHLAAGETRFSWLLALGYWLLATALEQGDEVGRERGDAIREGELLSVVRVDRVEQSSDLGFVFGRRDAAQQQPEGRFIERACCIAAGGG